MKTTARKRCSKYKVVHVREPVSFWRENLIGVVTLLREGQKSSRFIRQNNNFARASSFSLPSLHDYVVKMPNCKFYGGSKQATTNLFFLSLSLTAVLKKSTPGKFVYICHFQQTGINATKIEKTGIHFKTDVFTAVTVVDAKATLSLKIDVLTFPGRIANKAFLCCLFF